MALPGISFEIVKSSVPTLGLRTDRTALIAMTSRGRLEEPVLVHSHDECVEEFGCPLPGALGPVAAEIYFENGGHELIVCRFAGPAKEAFGSLPVVDSSSTLVGFTARDPGAFGNDIRLNVELEVLALTQGTLGGLSLDEITLVGLPFDPTGFPVRVFQSGVAPHWATTVSFVPSGPNWVLTFSPAPSGFSAGAVTVEIYSPLFTLRIREPLRPDVRVPGLDLRDVDASNELLDDASVRLDAFPLYAGVNLPTPDAVVRLSMGDDALDTGLAAREASFRNCIAALVKSDLPDIVIAPDLWSATWGSKRVKAVGFDETTAITLGDELVRSAAQTRDRVVLLDPPLTSYSATDQTAPRPLAVPELLNWRAERAVQLGADRDFAATHAPWMRIVAKPVYRGDDTLLVPPSAAVAGRMAQESRERGPWVATGNVPLERAIGLSDDLRREEQEELQEVGICPLIGSNPRGSTIKGVRSLSWPDRKAWRFLSTRRLFNFLRRALHPIGMSYVFEPNAPATWIRLRRELDRFLLDLFKRGALAGAAPNEAFVVQIDEGLNPESQRDNGVMTARIAVAPAFPLEFLVVRLVLGKGVTRVAEEPFVS